MADRDGGLTAADMRVLHEALDDEYKAYATYGQVLDDFGDVRPFSRIREAEGRHIEALSRLFRRHGLPLPANPWPGRVERFETLAAACEAGVTAEIANVAMYDRLLAEATREDVRAVLYRLQAASRDRHLPAFRRCAARERGGRTGRGSHGHGRGGCGRAGDLATG